MTTEFPPTPWDFDPAMPISPEKQKRLLEAFDVDKKVYADVNVVEAKEDFLAGRSKRVILTRKEGMGEEGQGIIMSVSVALTEEVIDGLWRGHDVEARSLDGLPVTLRPVPRVDRTHPEFVEVNADTTPGGFNPEELPGEERAALLTAAIAAKARGGGKLTAAGARRLVEQSLTLDGVLHQIRESARMGVDTVVLAGSYPEEVIGGLRQLGYKVERRDSGVIGADAIWGVMW